MPYQYNKQGFNYIKGTQDWQLEAYDMKSKHNSIIRHRRIIEEMENNNKWERSTK